MNSYSLVLRENSLHSWLSTGQEWWKGVNVFVRVKKILWRILDTADLSWCIYRKVSHGREWRL